MNNYERALALKDEIVGFRRSIHAMAEVGFDLPNTRNFIKEKLTEFGYDNIQEIGGGLVVTAGKGGKTFLIRSDMDALPMKEASGLPFASTNGNCHACGHDMHAAVLLGAAKILKQIEADLKGTVKIMFQPAEELLVGAKSMIEAGVLENPKVDCGMIGHVSSTNPLGVGLKYGEIAASSNNFVINITGKAAHGAMPQFGVDPIFIGAQIVIGLQEMITRELAFNKSAVLTIGHFEAGRVCNAIPQTALIEGTMRTFTPATQEYLKKRVPEIVKSIAATYRGSAEVEFTCDVPAFINDAALAGSIHKYVNELAEGNFTVFDAAAATASEDFADVAAKVPSFMFLLGAADPNAEVKYPVHHPKVTFSEDALSIGSAVFVECASRWLEENC